MTDEERFCYKRCRSNPCRHRCEYVSNYLDGLAKGKPQWYKVVDGDYPPCKKAIIIVSMFLRIEEKLLTTITMKNVG